MKKIKHKGLVIFILGLLSAIGPLSIDMYLPAFGDIAEGLGTSKHVIGYSFSSYFVGVSVGQLMYGPLLDRFGRKPVIYVGLLIYIISSIICVYAKTPEQFIGMRLSQAVGGCVGMVGSRAIIRDLFPIDDIAKVFSYLMLVIAISPILAPTFGGFLTSYIGWQSIFIILAVFGTFSFVGLYVFVPHGNPPDTELSLKPKPILRKFINVSKVPKFHTYALVSAISSSGLYVYIAASPTVFFDVFQVSKKQYGFIFAIIALGMIMANQANTILLKKYRSEHITIANLFIQIGIALLLVIGTYWNLLDLYMTIALLSIFTATQGFIYPNTSALSIQPFSRSAGTASALMGSVQLGIGALSTALVSTFITISALPMAVAILICALISTGLLFSLQKSDKYKFVTTARLNKEQYIKKIRKE